MVRTVAVFQDTMREVHRPHGEQEQMKAESERGRKDTLNRLAGEFETRLGSLAAALRTDSGELEATATTMTAERPPVRHGSWRAHWVRRVLVCETQTTLFAANAKIEAARRLCGRGFTVVASEVKNLASQTAKATEEIGTQITQIQEATDQVVLAIEGIVSRVDRASRISGSIASATEEQGGATAEIARVRPDRSSAIR